MPDHPRKTTSLSQHNRIKTSLRSLSAHPQPLGIPGSLKIREEKATHNSLLYRRKHNDRMEMKLSLSYNSEVWLRYPLHRPFPEDPDSPILGSLTRLTQTCSHCACPLITQPLQKDHWISALEGISEIYTFLEQIKKNTI